MALSLADYIGRRGEIIAFNALIAPRDEEPRIPYFWLHPFGEKGQTFDYLVELVGAGGAGPYFFVQVKTTWKALTTTQSPPRLRVEVNEEDVRRMAAWPAPTYVLGVHLGTNRVFIVSIHDGMREAIPSITTAHELTTDNLRRLWEEARAYWAGRNMSRPASLFDNGASS